MEDILASIRRIIAEDQSNSLGRGGLSGLTRRAQPAAPVALDAELAQPSAFEAEGPAVEAETHAGPHADTLHHTYETQSHDEPALAAHVEEPVADAHAEAAYEAEPAYAAPAHRDEDTQSAPSLALVEDEAEPLMSPSAGASITSSFQNLAESVMLQDPGLIERVMRESMRPLLKAWLDDHLPSIVERLVRTEIERVARGGRSRNA